MLPKKSKLYEPLQMVPATRPAVCGTVRLFVTPKMGCVSSQCSPPYRCDYLWLGGGIQNLGEQRQETQANRRIQAVLPPGVAGYLYSAWRMEGSGEEIRHADIMWRCPYCAVYRVLYNKLI